MRRLILAFLLVAFATPVFAYVSPGSPSGYVNDFAKVLSPTTKQTLESELSEFEKDTSNEIAVAIVPDMGGDYIENYAVQLFKEWGVGKRDKDNGVLLVVTMQEHKLRIEVGYGLEGTLPDSLAQKILDNEMTPRMRADDVDGAVTAAVHAIEQATQGEYTPAPSSPTWLSTIGKHFAWIFFGFVFVIQWLGSILARSKSWWAGGILGVVAGLGIGWFFAISAVITFGITLALALFGLLLDFLVSSTYSAHVGRGTTPPWWTGGGSFGGGSSSGSFGGFGGGSSGGGGASGGW
jgi:uncharacterized protein